VKQKSDDEGAKKYVKTKKAVVDKQQSVPASLLVWPRK
jgi:hypothetical protein